MNGIWDAIVIGSGFGGAVTACRLAEGGMKVLVLERGRRWEASGYPRKPGDAWLWDQDDPRECNGWIDMRVVNDRMWVAQGSGVGGGSLIYANISVEAQPWVFERGWPPEISHRELKPYYEKVGRMLNVQELPENQLTERHKLMREGAQKLGYAERFRKLPIAVSFDPDYTYDRPDPTGDQHSKKFINAQGVLQGTCVHCGNCDIGCQVKAKNTLDLNYIPWAEKHGAVVRPLHMVYKIEPDADRYAVHFNRIQDGRLVPGQETATRVVVACGSLGSTELLLRSRDQYGSLPDVSPVLGSGWSSNGDFLTPAIYRNRRVSPTIGPTITCAIDFLDGAADGRRIFVEDGGFPSLLKDFLDSGGNPARRHKLMVQWLKHFHVVDDPASEVMPWFGQSVDAADGKLYLGRVWYAPWRRKLKMKWDLAGTKPTIDALVNMHQRLSAATGGDPIVPFTWEDFGILITPHPLGGCRIGRSAADGVVDHRGEVFGYPNLYVADGAIVPRALGLNPSRTIAALAERISDLIVRDGGGRAGRTSSAPGRQIAPAGKMGIQFTETMKGFWTQGAASFEEGERKGKAADARFQFTLTVRGGDLNRMLGEPGHEARMTGTAIVPALSPNPLTISDGIFNLFVENPDEVETRNMRYRMTLASEEGKSWYFEGFKTIRENSVFDIWHDTSTLYITVHAGADPSSSAIGKGVLHIEPADFATQMTTLQVLNADDAAQRLAAMARFGKFFAGTVFQTYGGIFARPTAFDPSAPPREKRALRAGAPVLHPFRTKDGVPLLLTRYRGGSKGPVVLCHGLGVSSLIFSLDTVETNLLEYLYQRSYDVWLLDFRNSIELPASRSQSSGDDVALYDYPAAVNKVREVTGAPDVQMVVHCWGSTTFFMAMLAGLQGVRSAVCSQIATHFITPPATHIKAGLHLPSILDALKIKTLSAFASAQEDWVDKLFDAALRLYPVELKERCESPTCHRISFMYAPLYRHSQLNEATHATLHETFGVANMKAFEHLATLANKGRLVDFEGNDVYLPRLERLKLPITFIHGGDNECFLPESTQTTYELLCRTNGKDLYARHVISGYGHIDCIFGKNAVLDVYPLIVNALDSIGSGASAR